MDTGQVRTIDERAQTVVPPSTRWNPSSTRAHLEQLLSPWLAPQFTSQLWSETWGPAGVEPSSLEALLRLYGERVAALAVASGLSEGDIQRHLRDRRRPDLGVLEMLADLNCFPCETPAARPLRPPRLS
ncbi:MAG: hypothetical protein QOD98_42 [Nocardioidaceae bacterium]|jgi:hypothetical protein|nr:hypothetical protein [Nocardioidaceae bacterium]